MLQRGILIAYTQDLLKSIHHFASQFYAERGELDHIANEVRKERKERKKEREAHMTGAAPEKDGGVSVSEGEERGIMEKAGKAHMPENLGRTMYRAMEGSALVAIGGSTGPRLVSRSRDNTNLLGMLLQEHVAALIKPGDDNGDGPEDEELNPDQVTEGQIAMSAVPQ